MDPGEGKLFDYMHIDAFEKRHIFSKSIQKYMIRKKLAH